ncbi:MAG: hypothetical protein J2P37_15585 [Ktedonobacteraceae bacterium]|nr:hypothetical protein [Ktedonobacteraceae bacterium]
MVELIAKEQLLHGTLFQGKDYGDLPLSFGAVPGCCSCLIGSITWHHHPLGMMRLSSSLCYTWHESRGPARHTPCADLLRQESISA